MLISELANKYKISVRTLRYYESLGLLTANRNEANVREFDSSQIKRLESILVFKLNAIENELYALNYAKRLLISVLRTFGSDSTSLIQSIKELRKHLSEVHGLAFDKIRLMDNTDELQSFEYRIKSMDEVLFRAAINADSVESQIDHIITSLKTILLSRLT